MAGCAVVADAVYDRPADREAIEVVGREAGVPFVGFWLAAPLKCFWGGSRPARATRRMRPRQCCSHKLHATVERSDGSLSMPKRPGAQPQDHARSSGSLHAGSGTGFQAGAGHSYETGVKNCAVLCRSATARLQA